MDKSYKRKVFSLIGNKFETEQIKNYFLDMCEEIPDYIFTMPSSTSGKYHNATQCQKFGQLYHVFMFSSILEHLLRLEHIQEYAKTPEIRDCMRCVPVFHDAVKCGWNGSLHTVQDHPILAYNWVLHTTVEHDLDQKMKQFIADMCASHSGQWNKNRRGDPIMPKPRNNYEKLIHECDIMASRQDIDYIIPDDLKKVLEVAPSDPEPTSDPKDFVIRFGKHKGKTLGEIKKEDPSWITWAKENITTGLAAKLIKEI